MRQGLVTTKGRKYGGVGQPSKQLALNADGAYSVGVKVGRRGIDVVAIDFVGDLTQDHHCDVVFPGLDDAFETVASLTKSVRT